MNSFLYCSFGGQKERYTPVKGRFWGSIQYKSIGCLGPTRTVRTVGPFNRYGAEAWAFVRNDLCLPLDFSYFSVSSNGSENLFKVMQYTERQGGVEILPINHPKFRITWKYSNPIRYVDVQKEMRATMEWWLNK